MADKAKGADASATTLEERIAAARAARGAVAETPLGEKLEAIRARLASIAPTVEELEFLLDGLPAGSPTKAHLANVVVGLAHARNNVAAELSGLAAQAAAPTAKA